MDSQQEIAARLALVQDLIPPEVTERALAGSIDDRVRIRILLALAPLRGRITGDGAHLGALLDWLNRQPGSWMQDAGYDYAASIALDFIRAGLPLPPPLDGFVVSVLEGNVSRGQKGPRGYVNDYRNALILHAIHEAITTKGAGIAPTRNDGARKHDSACDRVAEALELFGHFLSYRAVATIWEDFQSALNRQAEA